MNRPDAIDFLLGYLAVIGAFVAIIGIVAAV